MKQLKAIAPFAFLLASLVVWILAEQARTPVSLPDTPTAHQVVASDLTASVTPVTQPAPTMAIPQAVPAVPCVQDAATTAWRVLADYPAVDTTWIFANVYEAGLAFTESRVVVIDFDLQCNLVASTIYHEWFHMLMSQVYGTRTLAIQALGGCGETMPIFPQGCRSFELIADCASQYLAQLSGVAEYHAYLTNYGCPPDLRAIAIRVINGHVE